MDTTDILSYLEGVRKTIRLLDKRITTLTNLLNHLENDVRQRQIFQEHSRLARFLSSDTCPIKDLPAKNIKVIHISKSKNVNLKGRTMKLVHREFCRYYCIGKDEHLLKISGKHVSSTAPAGHKWKYFMIAEYRNHRGSVYYEGKSPQNGLERTEMGKSRFREIVQLILRDLKGREEQVEEVGGDAERLKGVIEMFWGKKIARKRLWVGRRGFERCVWLADYALDLERNPNFEEES